MRRSVLALALVVAPAAAWANGRPPQAVDLHFRPGHDSEILIAATFGALTSTDNGDTWRWTCETAIGYGGTFDPDYTLTASGTIIATTFDGIQLERDGCTFAPSAFGVARATRVAGASDGTIYVAMSYAGDQTQVPPDPPDAKIYTSTDDAVSFTAGVTVGTGGEEWTSLEPAPSDPARVYLTGYRLDGSNVKTQLLYRSDDGAQSFAPLPVAVFEVTMRSELEIAAISPTDPDRALLRVSWWSPAGVIGDAFYLTTNAGEDWVKVLETNDNAAGVVFRANGDAVIGTARSGIYRSTNGGQDFTLLPGVQPDIFCLRERTNGELWACTSNYEVPPMNFGVMKTTDLVTWTGVMRFEDDIVGPVECAAGTIQQDCCTIRVAACPEATTPSWCFLQSQLGIRAMPFSCAPPDAPGEMPPGGGGCCDAGAEPVGIGLLTVLAALGMTRRKRAGA